MRITGVASTELFVGPADDPLQVVRVSLAGNAPAGGGPLTALVTGDGLTVPAPVTVADAQDAEEVNVEIAVAVDARHRPGDEVTAEVRVTVGDTDVDGRAFSFVVAEPGWRMFMVSHFHYDPVWWNTQAHYTETWEKWSREDRPWEGRKQHPAFTLVDAHIDLARRDPDYRFVLAELDYLKPYLDTFPDQRAYLRQLMAEGRLELMGGTYNEANGNLTSAESTIRNAVYGVGYQRDVLGGDPATAWQLDVFGHDPQFPGLMADAGLTSSSWARGPFHQWGPNPVEGGNARMQFASEFDWVSPSGAGLLTCYMANHYAAGWELDDAPTLDAAMAEALRLFTELKVVAATRNVLLPVGTDYTPPNRWITQVHREWNARYTWPRFEIALPRDFFAAVRAELAETGGASPQTRDMNPVYTGKDVSYIDTKQAQRAGENVLAAAEMFATVAALLGARYPAEAFDKAWRQLLFNAHHDGITGTESDQVYLDLVGGWRDTWELAREGLDNALDHIGRHIDTAGPEKVPGDGGASQAHAVQPRAVQAHAVQPRAVQPLAVFNSLSWERTDVVRARVELASPSPGLRLTDETGADVPFVVEAETLDEDGGIVGCTLGFVAADVPSIGYRTYWLHPEPDLPSDARWRPEDGDRISNEFFEVAVDADRGGAICHLVDRTTDRSLLKTGELANEVLAYDEYATHPEYGEGPWHLMPVGAVESAAAAAATVTVERSAIGERVISRTGDDGDGLRGCTIAQEMALYTGVPRVECATSLDGFTEHDVLLRMRVAADVPGGMPVSEVGNAVVGRGFGFPLVDAAEFPYTLDNPAYNWFGIGATARVALHDPDSDDAGKTRGPHEQQAPRASRAISVAELIVPDDWVTSEEVRDAVVGLVRTGVTSTVSRCTGSRYGSIDVDSNLPDVRVAIGGPDDNVFVAELLAAVDDGYRARIDEQLAGDGEARVWVPAREPLSKVWQPGADLRGVRDLPALIVAGRDRSATQAAVAALTADLDDFVIDVRQPGTLDGATDVPDDFTVAVCSQGLPSFNVDARGDLYLSFLRSCSGWPSGVWLDPPVRTVPDGSSFQFQHWTHVFRYALIGGAGDWRELGAVRSARAHNNPMIVRQLESHGPHGSDGSDGGPLPSRAAFLTVDSDDVVVTTLKPLGNPMARMAGTTMNPTEGVAVRLYECHGRSPRVRMGLFTGLREGFVTDVLEEARRPAEVSDGRLTHRLEPYEVATLGATIDPQWSPGSPERQPGPQLGRRGEPAQPVFSDYWLHNKGAGPLGYQPVTVHIPVRALSTDEAFDVPVVVGSERTDAASAGTVEIVTPEGWRASPAAHPYRLAPGAHMAVTGTVTPPSDAAPGRYFVAAQIRDEAGQVHEDVVTVDYRVAHPELHRSPGESAGRALLLDRATRKAVVVEREPDPATMTALGGELDVAVAGDAIAVEPGGHGSLEVRLRNLVCSDIRGEAQVISPWGTWEHVGPWTQGFTVPAQEDATVQFALRAPVDAPPTRAWALVKVMYFGRVLYSPAVALVLGSPNDGG